MIEFYRNLIIEVVYFDKGDEGYHWFAYRQNKRILDSLKQFPFPSQKDCLNHAHREIDWFLGED